MSLKQISLLSFILMLVLVTSACSGGAGEQLAKNLPTETINNGKTDKSDGSDSSGGIGGSGVLAVNIIGPITAITDTINVKGIEWELDENYIFFEDWIPPSERTLKIGMVAVVLGDVNPDGATGVAHEVHVIATLIGPIESIGENGLMALGQEVVVTDQTIFDPDNVTPPSLYGLTVADDIIVYAHFTGKGILEASLIQKLATAPARQKITGLVTSVDSDRIQVGQIVIDIKHSEWWLPDDDRPIHAIEVDDYVEVIGLLDEGGTTFIADQVNRTGHFIAENEYLDLVGGIVHSANPVFTQSSSMGDIDFVINDETQFHDGLTAEDLFIGRVVRLTGQFKNGMLHVEAIYDPH